MKSARQTAFEILLKIQKDGAYSNLAVDSMLSENAELDSRDSAFVSALVYGTTERRISVDYNLSLYLTQPIKKLKPELLTVLRMGAYQILFMDKVPDSAAVNESVKLAKENKSAFAAALVNAVLRKVAQNGFMLPEGDDDSPEKLEVLYSIPQWILKLWIDSYGYENAVGTAAKVLEPSKTVLRVNTVNSTADGLVSVLESEGVTAVKSDIAENSLILEKQGSVEKLVAYKEGLFHVQDFASQLCVKALDPQPGETVFDLCSAPGGKAFTIAETMQGQGSVNAFDIYQSRVELIRSGAKRLCLSNVKPFLSDASVFNENYGKADRVLCDVPCSGLGIIGRKPEIRFKTEEEILNLPELQFGILCNARRYLKDSGRLVYSTCALNPAENEEVCKRFLDECREFESVPVLPQVKGFRRGDYLTLMPHLNGTDGFFIAAFQKRGCRE
ncbi:MAG: 16S rRNA (cytosine(967)-C(5))-methyltransferase RsmB [Clostridia bacterium]|nr:16S rRNA (cytosine(967)-C(5))-methyltransferase RsmB [Clostridia bacterium]